MTVQEFLPWLNVLLVPALGYLISIERRLTRLETFREAEDARNLRSHHQPSKGYPS